MVLSSEIHPHSSQYLPYSRTELGLPLISAEYLENKIHSRHTGKEWHRPHMHSFLNTQSSLPDVCGLQFHCKESQHEEGITSLYTFSHGNTIGNESSSTKSLMILKESYCFLDFRQGILLHDALCQDALKWGIPLWGLLRHRATFSVCVLKSSARYQCYSFILPSSWKAFKKEASLEDSLPTQYLEDSSSSLEEGFRGQCGGLPLRFSTTAM